MRNGMCAATSETLRFSSTMTRTFSTPLAGDAECKPGSGEPDGGAGTGRTSEPEQALTARSTTARATAAAARRHDRAHRFTALFAAEMCTGCNLLLHAQDPIRVDAPQPVVRL